MKEKNNLKKKIFYKENKPISWMNNKMKEKNKKMVRNASIIIIYLNFFLQMIFSLIMLMFTTKSKKRWI